jgi:hypothetical protein
VSSSNAGVPTLTTPTLTPTTLRNIEQMFAGKEELQASVPDPYVFGPPGSASGCVGRIFIILKLLNFIY